MPSSTVPMFSNSMLTSHMIHCDMPLSRSARLMAMAMAPTVMALCIQSQIDSAATAKASR